MTAVIAPTGSCLGAIIVLAMVSAVIRSDPPARTDAGIKILCLLPVISLIM